MDLNNFFTFVSEDNYRYLGFDAGDDPDFVIDCSIKIYVLPENLSEEEEEEILYHPKDAKQIGSIEGELVLGAEIMRYDKDYYTQCDDAGAMLEFVVSALMESNGPLIQNEYCNFFYVEEVNIEKKYHDKLFDTIIEKLPEIMLTHYHVSPDIIAVNPDSLPYDDTLEEIERNLAHEIHSKVKKQMRGEKDPDEPIYHLTEDQFCIQMGVRRPGESYPESAIDKEEWQLWQRNGFKEWKNTRVLYKIL